MSGWRTAWDTITQIVLHWLKIEMKGIYVNMIASTRAKWTMDAKANLTEESMELMELEFVQR